MHFLQLFSTIVDIFRIFYDEFKTKAVCPVVKAFTCKLHSFKNHRKELQTITESTRAETKITFKPSEISQLQPKIDFLQNPQG